MVEGDFQFFEGKWSVEQVRLFSSLLLHPMSVVLDPIPFISFHLVLIV